jgi:hypothetical protein
MVIPESFSPGLGLGETLAIGVGPSESVVLSRAAGLHRPLLFLLMNFLDLAVFPNNWENP